MVVYNTVGEPDYIIPRFFLYFATSFHFEPFQPLRVVLKEEASYRLKKVEVRRKDAIDQVTSLFLFFLFVCCCWGKGGVGGTLLTNILKLLQIRFSYSDMSVLALGHDTGGKADLNPMILAEGEYLVNMERSFFFF